MQKNIPNYISVSLLLLFTWLNSLAASTVLRAKSIGDNTPRLGLKSRIDIFIKDVVNDIVNVSASNKTTNTTSTETHKTAIKPSISNTEAIPATSKSPNPIAPKIEKTPTQAHYEIIVLDNILYIDGQAATQKRVAELTKIGINVGNDLLRYIPTEPVTTKANSITAPSNKLIAKHIAPVENYTPITLKENSNAGHLNSTNAIAAPVNVSNIASSYGADKVVLADIYKENIPCNNHYDNNWNNKDIHAYRCDLSKMPGSVTFLLTHGLGGDFVMPVSGDVEVTSGFGPRWGKYHNGIDLDLETGDQVKAAFDGKVRIAQYSNSFGYVVVIRHFNGLETTYAHLSKLMVSENQDIKAGSLVGLGGNTGRSRGSHLHFELRYKGHPMNPREMIDFEQNTLKNNIFTVDRSYFSSSNPYEDAHTLGAHSHEHSADKAAITTKSKTLSHATKYHTVKKGDTISEIADKYNVSMQKVCSLNKISSKTTLKPGRKLRVK